MGLQQSNREIPCHTESVFAVLLALPRRLVSSVLFRGYSFPVCLMYFRRHSACSFRRSGFSVNNDEREPVIILLSHPIPMNVQSNRSLKKMSIKKISLIFSLINDEQRQMEYPKRNQSIPLPQGVSFLRCPRCQQPHFVKNGFINAKQRYKCKECKYH